MSSEAASPDARLRGVPILVTGASGYLGRRLVPRLIALGAQVAVQVRRDDESWAGLDVMQGDLRDPAAAEALRRGWRWQQVVHLAGSVTPAAKDFASEADAARAHLQLALAVSRALPVGFAGRVVHASSMSVYGSAPELPVPEHQRLTPRFLYAVGKVIAEDVWSASSCEDCWCLRLPGLFSAERKSGALFHFTRAALLGQPIQISAAEPTLWDVLHVDDAVEAIVRALASRVRLKGPINVSYGEVVDLMKMARLVARLTTGVDVINLTGVTHPPFQLDIGLARQLIAWPPCNLETRITELVHELADAGI
jgi:nucleoside-diphosphate-sugar epimerase